MVKSFLKRFKDDRRYFTIVFFVLILIFLTAVISPILVERKQAGWQSELNRKIKEIENSVSLISKNKEQSLLITVNNLKDGLTNTLIPGGGTYGELVAFVNDEKFVNYAVHVIAPNGRLIAWNRNTTVFTDNIFPFKHPLGETHFSSTDIITYLTVNDTVHIDHDLFYVIVSLPIEKHYSLQNIYFEEINFTNELANRFNTEFEVVYNPFSQKSKDGRKYSFEILNNHNNKIGLVTFIKPALNTAIGRFNENTEKIQSLLACLVIIFAALGFRNEFKEFQSRVLKLAILIVFATVGRAIFFFLSFPSNIISGPITDSAYFASTFGYGIVRSPLEFLITNIFLLLIAVSAFSYLNNYIREEQKSKQINSAKHNILLIIPLTYLFYVTMRGLNASIKSVIMDSSLRYFKEPDLIPDLPVMMMHMNVLMIGAAAVLILICYLLIAFHFLPRKNKQQKKYFLVGFFFFLQLSGIIYLTTQPEPLITIPLSAFFTALIFIIAYQIFRGKPMHYYNYIYITIMASVITITLLNYFNLELEKQSLKTTAFEVNRPNEGLLRFLLDETLRSAAKSDEVISGFNRRTTNNDALAFTIWSNSSLQRESLNSVIYLFGRNKTILGSFGIGFDDEQFPTAFLTSYRGNELQLFETSSQFNSDKRLLYGISSVTDRGIVLGYVVAAIGIDRHLLNNRSIPEFLASGRNVINTVIDVKQLNIFEIVDGRLTNVYGDIYPSREQIEPIIKAKYSTDNEARLNLSINNENYILYAIKFDLDGSEKITAVMMKEKQLTWNLFNFFKVFIIHSLFFLALFLLIFFVKIRSIKYSFRTQLLIAFLIVSIIPVIVLAIYNRQEVKEGTRSAIFNELNERAEYLENHVAAQLRKNRDRTTVKAFDNAAKELGLSFTVYENSDQIYASNNQFYRAGLFSPKLNSLAHYNLNYLSYREFLSTDKIENYEFNTFYKKITIGENSYILSVNDAFNKVNITLSTVEADIFLFGVYSLAVIIIIVVSTLLANTISSPIRRLTKATQSVAQGDLNVVLQNIQKGELRELITGFNSMTIELQKNQMELAELERENAWKEMAKQVAHEIKNPLTPMKLAVQQLIASYKDKTKSFENIFERVSATLLNQIETLNHIASEFSRFARMPNFRIEDVDIIPVTRDTVNLFIDEKIKIEFKTTLNTAVVEADSAQIRRMLINLIRNSIQASSTSIKLLINDEDDSFVIYVEDNGKGIPDLFKERIFDANFTTKEKGMGLGLKMAKRFLDGINGSITLQRSSHAGTLFRIRIPKRSRAQ